MSRRQKRKAQAESGQKNKLGKKLIWLTGSVVVLVIAVLVTVNWAKGYMHSDEFRNKVEDQLGMKVGTPVVLERLKWDGLHLESDGFSAESVGALQSVEASNLALDVDTDYWGREVWEISNVEVDTAAVRLDLTKDFTTLNLAKEPSSWFANRLPDRAELNDVKVRRADAEIVTDRGTFGVKGVQITADKEDFGYRVSLEKGDVSLPFPILKSAELIDAKLRFLNDRLVLDKVEVGVFEKGQLLLEGEIDTKSFDYEINGEVRNLRCSDVVDEDWKQRLSGDAEAKFSVQPGLGNEPEINGVLFIKNGELTALPVLDTIASYTKVGDFKRLKFSEFRCDFNHHKNLTKLTNIYVHCEGLVRVEGAIDINGKSLKGRFRVGLNSRALRNIPGAEDRVFLPGREGMSWATVNIGGTTDDITEDITTRLKAAALGRILEFMGGESAIKLGEDALDVAEKLTDDGVLETTRDASGKLLEVGLDVLGKDKVKEPIKAGSSLIEAGLNGLFGGSSSKSRDNSDEEE